MHIKKKPSLSKINEKKLSSTARDIFWPKEGKSIISQKQQIPKVPTFRRNIRNISSKRIESKPRIETQTTLSESTMMFQSMYGGKDWLKPSDYLKQIKELNLLGEERKVEVKSYDINLNDKLDKNLQKFGRLKEVTEKWVQVLKKALSYLRSTKASSDKLIEEVKYWKALSKKFDELQYEFKEEKTLALLNIMKTVLKTEPSYKPLLEEFMIYKEEIITVTPSVKRLYLQLQELVSGYILKFQQCSDICESIALLKKIMIGFDSIYQENPLIKVRFSLIYEKIDQCMTQKLLATSLYPRQLANISSVKENYHIMDQVLSFYSLFLNSLESSDIKSQELIDRVEHTRMVVANLLQILTYFQFLYNSKEVHQFSKLFSHVLNYNIYDRQYRQEWNEYMDIVNNSMEKYKFEP